MSRVLVVGWASFVHGEATAGDVESLSIVAGWLAASGIPYDIALSPAMAAPGSVLLDDVNAANYTDLLFACGPLAGWQVRDLHIRFAGCRRMAVGVSVPVPEDAAAAGFSLVIARDGPGFCPTVDLAGMRPVSRPVETVPVLGVCLANSQPEYAAQQQHERVHRALTAWLTDLDAAKVPFDTRLDPANWRLAAKPGQLDALLRRLDAIVTTRLHGLVLGLRAGVPVLAVDPVLGGAKVAAQAKAWGWPAVVGAGELVTIAAAGELRGRLDWCLSEQGRVHARACAREAAATAPVLKERLLAALVAQQAA